MGEFYSIKKASYICEFCDYETYSCKDMKDHIQLHKKPMLIKKTITQKTLM
jgi:hypothetical protein